MRDEVQFWKHVNYIDAMENLFLAQNVNEALSDSIPFSSTAMNRIRKIILQTVCEVYHHAVFLDVSIRIAHHSPHFLHSIQRILYTQGSVVVLDASDVDTPATVLIEGYTFGGKGYEWNIVRALAIRPQLYSLEPPPPPPPLLSTANSDLRFYLVDSDQNGDNSFCFIHVRNDLLHNFILLHRPNLSDSSNALTRTVETAKLRSSAPVTLIGVGIPTVSKGISHFHESSLIRTFLPHFIQSVEGDENGKFRFILYIGFDRGDIFWDADVTGNSFAKLNASIHALLKNSKNISIRYHRLPYTHGWLTFIWNYLFSNAMAEGCDYFYQVNDDLRIDSPSWASSFTGALKQNGDFGVVGPFDPVWNCTLLTQSMVSRTHWDIFGYFYPPEVAAYSFIDLFY